MQKLEFLSYRCNEILCLNYRMAVKLQTMQRGLLWTQGRIKTKLFSIRNLNTSTPKSLKQVRTASTISVANDTVDFSAAIEDFKRNGMAILPLKIDPNFVEISKEKCFAAYRDALNRAKVVRGHEMKVGMEYGFQEFVARAEGRYDMHWMVNKEKHFLDEENVLSKFMPFFHNILGENN